MSRILAAVALAALAAVALVGPGASAQSGRTITFTELEKGSTFKHVRNTKPKSAQSNLLGDVIVFTNRIADASGKVIGKNHAVCATTVGRAQLPQVRHHLPGVGRARRRDHDLAGRVQGRRVHQHEHDHRRHRRLRERPRRGRLQAGQQAARTTRSPW